MLPAYYTVCFSGGTDYAQVAQSSRSEILIAHIISIGIDYFDMVNICCQGSLHALFVNCLLAVFCKQLWPLSPINLYTFCCCFSIYLLSNVHCKIVLYFVCYDSGPRFTRALSNNRWLSPYRKLFVFVDFTTCGSKISIITTMHKDKHKIPYIKDMSRLEHHVA